MCTLLRATPPGANACKGEVGGAMLVARAVGGAIGLG